MASLLDTGIVIPFLAGDSATKRLVDALIPAGIAISMVTYMEVLQGVIDSADPRTAQSKFDAFLAGVPVLPFTSDVARRCAQLRSDLMRQGKRVRPRALDLITAATALRHDLTLVTRNKADFRDIDGLAIQ